MKRSVRKSSELDEIVEAMEFFSGIEKKRLGSEDGERGVRKRGKGRGLEEVESRCWVRDF